MYIILVAAVVASVTVSILFRIVHTYINSESIKTLALEKLDFSLCFRSSGYKRNSRWVYNQNKIKAKPHASERQQQVNRGDRVCSLFLFYFLQIHFTNKRQSKHAGCFSRARTAFFIFCVTHHKNSLILALMEIVSYSAFFIERNVKERNQIKIKKQHKGEKFFYQRLKQVTASIFYESNRRNFLFLV